MQAKRNKKLQIMCLGSSSILHLLKEQLLHYIFELHEPRLAVFARLAVVKAVSLTRDF